jgi:hypothetical protein
MEICGNMIALLRARLLFISDCPAAVSRRRDFRLAL